MRLYPKIRESASKKITLLVHKYNNGKHTTETLKAGENLVVEGGPSTGKTSFLKKTIRKLEGTGEQHVFINGALPIGDWVKQYRLFGKNLEARINYFKKALPEEYYLVVDNAEQVQAAKKLELVLYLLENSRSAIIGCTRYGLLNPKLKVRLGSKVKLHSLGTGADTFDVTYFVVAILIVAVALMGAHHLVFLAAAFRYIFQGTRIGGRK